MNRDKPYISIIIPIYNKKDYIEEAIKSVINQKYPNTELIIIDGNSTDGSWDIVKQYKEYISYCLSEPDTGIYDAMNKGVAVAKGQWIYFLGADDRLELNVIEQIEPFLTTDLAMVYGDIQFDDGWRFPSMLNLRTLLQNTVHHQGAFYNRYLFEKFRYNTDLRILSDYELNLIIYLQKLPTLKILLVIATCHSGGASSEVSLAIQETNLIRKKYITNTFYNRLLSSLLNGYYFQKRLRFMFQRKTK